MDPQKKKELWKKFRDFLIEQMKGKAVKLALKALLGSAYAVGFKAWLIKFVAEELIEEVGEPVARAVLVKVGYAYHKVEGKVIVKKIEEARDENDGQSYDDAVDDVFDGGQ